MNKMKWIIQLFIICYNVGLALGQLPISCYNSMVKGQWRLSITEPTQYDYGLNNTCGHQIPDQTPTSYKAMDRGFVVYKSFVMNLMEDGQLDTLQEFIDINGYPFDTIFRNSSNRMKKYVIGSIKKGKSKDFEKMHEKYSGTNNRIQSDYWTMLYNQGFEIKYQNVSFLMFNKYYYEGQTAVVDCGKTIVGWYRNSITNQYGCVKGYLVHGDKVKRVYDPFGSWQINKGRVVMQFKKIVKSVSNNHHAIDNNNSHNHSHSHSHNHSHGHSHNENDSMKMKRMKKMKDMHLQIVDVLNSKQNRSWVAKYSDIVEQQQYQYGIESIGRKLKKTKRCQSQQSSLFMKTGEYQKLQDKVDGLLELNNKKQFSWTDYLDYSPYCYAQDTCRSCATISFVNMVDLRLRLGQKRANTKKRLNAMILRSKKKDSEQSNNKNDKQQDESKDSNENNNNSGDQYMDKLSVQFLLDCNFYNQACEGGFAQLDARFGSEQIMIEDRHKTYLFQNGNCRDIRDIDDIKRGVKIGDYGYIGGRYSQSNHYNIMKEMMENGPVVLSFKIEPSFLYYSEGVYQPYCEDSWINGEASTRRPEWTMIDHSVLCYGWGVEKGLKYWQCLNSWGSNWGENGSFKILRGVDVNGIESHAEYADPYVVELGPQQQSFVKRYADVPVIVEEQ